MRLNKIKPQSSKLTLAKVRLIARLKGDGSIYVSGRKKTNYFIKYESNNLAELKQFANDLKKVYGLRPKFTTHRSGINPRKFLKVVYVRSKLAYEDLQKYGPFASREWRVPSCIKEASRRIQAEFLRIFFEDEGTVNVKGKEVRLYSINKVGLEEIRKMLRNFRIIAKIRGGFGQKRNVYAIIIRGKDNLSLFKKFIGFRSKRKNKKLEKIIRK